MSPDNRVHYVTRGALRLTPIATGCGLKGMGRHITTSPDKVTCALCQSSDIFLDATDTNEQLPVEIPEWRVIQDASTGDYLVLGEDPPVTELARLGHWVYLRGAAKLETEAYEKLRLASVYRAAVEVMIEKGE